MSSKSKRLKKSKRNALRFFCNRHTVTYKTAYEEGKAFLVNISSGGCAFESATIPLSLKEKILISIELGEKQNRAEARAVVTRVGEDLFAVKFTLIELPTQCLIRTYFAQQLRDK